MTTATPNHTRTPKKRAPSVATSTLQESQLKSHEALNVKNDNTKSHPNTKKCLLSVETSTPQVSQLKSPDALNVKRQLKFQGNSVTNPYLNTKRKVSSFKSPAKTTTIQALSSIATPLMKVSLQTPPKRQFELEQTIVKQKQSYSQNQHLTNCMHLKLI